MYPLPVADNNFSLFGKSNSFTSLDLKSGYWQVLIKESDKPNMAFACHFGSFQIQCHAIWSFKCNSSVSEVDVYGFARP